MTKTLRTILRCAAGMLLCLHAFTATAQGYVVPIGGALKYDNDEVWSRLVQLAGGTGARFAVFAMASTTPDKSAASIVDALTRHGAVAEYVRVDPTSSASPNSLTNKTAIEKLAQSQGVYFSGGAQERITAALLQADGKPGAVLEAIWNVYKKGGVVAGSSAGAAIMSATMIRDAPDVLGVLKFGAQPGKEIDRGLGFVGPDIFVDQHFLKRGRFGRMLPVMLQTGYKLGFGVDENTAAIVHGDEVEVIGAKGVLIVDFTDVSTDRKLGAFNVKNATLSYLERGDRYSFKTRIAMPSPAKLAATRLDPSDPKYNPYFTTNEFYPDILGDAMVLNVMTHLIDNKQREMIGLAFAAPTAAKKKDAKPNLGFEFRFRKGAGSLGYFDPSAGGENYTVTNIYLDVRPVQMRQPLYDTYPTRQTTAN